MNANASPIDIALDYIGRGWAPLPVPHKSKKPDFAEWQHLRITAGIAPRYFNGRPQNIGVILGAASGGLTDLDLDCREAVAVAPWFLPRTGAIFGRPSRRSSHWLYQTTLASEVDGKAIEFRDPTLGATAGAMLVEIRIGGGGKGAQTIMPGSVHESDEPISWDEDSKPALVCGADLRRRVERLAASALLARYWPGGARHRAALVLGGILARIGWDAPSIKLFVEATARAAGDPEVADRKKAAEDAAANGQNGGTACGFPALKEVFGDGVATAVCGWLGYDLGGTSNSGTFGERPNADPGPQDWPDPQALPSGLLPVAAFDVEMVPASIGPWVMDIAERMQCPPDFVAASAVVALAAVLGRKVAVRPQAQTDWTEVPNLWGCIVGRPGAMKSPAMSEAMKPLNRLEADARERNAAAVEKYEREKEAFDLRKEAAKKLVRSGKGDGGLADLDAPEKPKAKRFVCNDATYEALGEILAANPNGVLAFRDELVSLLKTLDREENAAARGFFLTAWNGTQGYTFDRIMRGLTHVDAACVSLLGSTQPGRLADYLARAVKGTAGDDGLIQRFSLLVWPDDIGSWREVDRYPNTQARHNAWATFTRLHELAPQAISAEQSSFDDIPFLRLDEAARDTFSGWRAALEQRLRAGGLHASLESHLSKYRKLVPSLALLFHLADGGAGPITETAVLRALSFAEYLESHARRAYGSGHQLETDTARAILARIRKGDIRGDFTARDIQRKDWSNLTDKDQISAGLDLLDDLHWIRSRRVDTGGRPKMVFTVSPRATA